MKLALIVIGSIIGAIITLYILYRMITGAARRRLLRTTKQKFSEESILLWTVNANFFGLQSKQGKQVRGNCALVLTKDVLWYSLGAPQREFSIPLQKIRSITFTRSHCGKSVFVDLLRVVFAADDQEDAAAWYVRDPQKWRKAIEEQRHPTA